MNHRNLTLMTSGDLRFDPNKKNTQSSIHGNFSVLSNRAAESVVDFKPTQTDLVS